MRCKTNSYIVTIRLDASKEDGIILDKRFRIACHIYNVLVKHAIGCLDQLERDKEYKYYLNILCKDKKNKDILKKLNAIRLKHGLSEYQFHSYVVTQKKMYSKNIDINTAQKIATRAWSAVSSYLFKGGEELHFRKSIKFNSLEGKDNIMGIMFKGSYIKFKGLTIPLKYKKNDEYILKALNDRVKYVRIIRRRHKSKWRYYTQLILEGRPPKLPEYLLSEDVTGIDIGPSSIALVNSDKAELLKLASNVKKIEKEIRVLNRRSQRQRIINNPNNYNKDGTIKKGHKKWHLSKRLKKTYSELSYLYQKRADQLRQSHFLLTNYILKEYGTDLIVEDIHWAALTKKAKETKKNKKGKFQSKKRYGKSIANHGPSLFLEILDNKLGYINKSLTRVDTFKTRATQFDHISGEYNKHDLKERMIKLANGDIIQRDLHSAFNLKHLNKDNYDYDVSLMNKNYERFLSNHDRCISNLLEQKKKGKKILSSMI